MEKIKLHDKEFLPYIHSKDIQERINHMAHSLNEKYKDRSPVFLVILNGAAFFATDLLKSYKGPCSIQFIRLSSYEGDTTTGMVRILTAIPGDLRDKDIVILEDIVDTGITMKYFRELLQKEQPASVMIVSLLDKPSRRIEDIGVDLVGFTIPDVFVVGYGLDYNELGRNSEIIYRLEEDQSSNSSKNPVS